MPRYGTKAIFEKTLEYENSENINTDATTNTDTEKPSLNLVITFVF